jgi:hypothetical protein
LTDARTRPNLQERTRIAPHGRSPAQENLMAESAGIDVTGPEHERFDEALEARDVLAALHRECVGVLPLPAHERKP